MKKPNKFLTVPDKFYLEKAEMIKVFDAVKNHWKKDELSMLENASYIGIMEMTKATLTMTKMKVLEKIWYSIIIFTEELETLNALKGDIIENPDSAEKEKLLAIEWHRIESGEAFVEN